MIKGGGYVEKYGVSVTIKSELLLLKWKINNPKYEGVYKSFQAESITSRLPLLLVVVVPFKLASEFMEGVLISCSCWQRHWN